MHWKASALLTTAFILSGASYLAVAGEGKDAAINKDRKALQGKWKTDKDNKAGIRSIQFEGNKFIVTFKADDTATGTYSIDPTQKPRTIDMKVTGGSAKEVDKFKGKASLGIYEFDGAHLKWHGNAPGQDERPKGFAEATHVLIVFERAKK